MRRCSKIRTRGGVSMGTVRKGQGLHARVVGLFTFEEREQLAEIAAQDGRSASYFLRRLWLDEVERMIQDPDRRENYMRIRRSVRERMEVEEQSVAAASENGRGRVDGLEVFPIGTTGVDECPNCGASNMMNQGDDRSSATGPRISMGPVMTDSRVTIRGIQYARQKCKGSMVDRTPSCGYERLIGPL